jgi:hypothetical protein
MAKFTVYFKDKVIKSHLFDSGVIHIGRDETNDLTIDNLAVAPAHAVVILKDDSCIMKQLNDDFPLIVNNEKSKESLLQNTDEIIIGKHRLIYNTTETILSANIVSSADKDIKSLNGKLEQSVILPDATLQVLDGPHIGRMMPLKKAMTRLGQSGTGVVVISKRKDGYFVSVLEGDSEITVNGKTLGDQTLLLNNNDIVVVDKVSMQFFIEH